MPVLVSAGKLGGLGGLGVVTGSRGIASLSYIPVYNRNGAIFGCPYAVANVAGIYFAVTKWVETALNTHVLIDATYVALNLLIRNAVGAQLTYPEPIECTNANGVDFYVDQYARNADNVLFKIIV